MPVEAGMPGNTATTTTNVARFFRVLVVEDNLVDCEITIRYLARAWPFERDMKVDTVTDGSAALEKLRRERYALVVLDWRLPGMSGAELLRRLRQDGCRAPVVVVSGLTREQIPEDLGAMGAVYLGKDEMNALTFHRAIAEALRQLGMTSAAATSTG